MEYEAVIGLEIHSHLLTESKIFCSCSTKFGADQNTHVCPICCGYPGTLPVLNKKAVEYTIKTGLAMNCEISNVSKFDRKNYYYPDLPKAYQISQYDKPICGKGFIEITIDEQIKKIGINRIHLEEDAGKLVHSSDDFSVAGYSLVDLNRTGTPLMEIVSEPDMNSPEEAYQYLSNIKQILEYIGVSDCNMEEGSLRCDANVSIRKKGDTGLGVKAELKNMNSFKNVRAALEYEVKRQIKEIKKGNKIVQETRLWDANKNVSFTMRTKEEAHDYRYFPEPDLVTLEISDEEINKIKNTLPELPAEKRNRFIKEFELSEYDSSVLTSQKDLSDYFEETVKKHNSPKKIANWIMVEFSAKLNEDKLCIFESKIKPEHLAELVKLIENNVISGKIAKKVFKDMYETGKTAEVIVEEKGLKQVTDTSQIEEFVKKAITENPNVVEDYKNGKTKALGFLMGQVMRFSKGKANPGLVNKMLIEKLKS